MAYFPDHSSHSVSSAAGSVQVDEQIAAKAQSRITFDKFCKCIPIIATVNAIFDMHQKHVYHQKMKAGGELKAEMYDDYHKRIMLDPTWEQVALLIPVLGQIVVAISAIVEACTSDEVEEIEAPAEDVVVDPIVVDPEVNGESPPTSDDADEIDPPSSEEIPQVPLSEDIPVEVVVTENYPKANYEGITAVKRTALAMKYEAALPMLESGDVNGVPPMLEVAKAGDDTAQYKLGVYYLFHGENTEKAKFWLNQAANNGNFLAQGLIDSDPNLQPDV